MTEEQIKIGNKTIAEFMGFIYFEPNVLIDNSDCGGIYDPTDVYSKVPIEVNDYPEDEQKYFKDLPNPDFGNKDSKRWRSDLKKLSWATLNWNNYMTDLKFHESWDWLIPALNKAYGIIDDFYEKDKENEERKYYTIRTTLFNVLNTFLSNEYENGKKTEMYNVSRAWKHLLDFIECYNRYNYEQELLKNKKK